MNIAQHLERAARHFPTRAGIVFEGRAITYATLQERVDRTAYALLQLRIKPGDRVGLFLPNIPEFAIAYLAIQKVGGIAVSANVMLTTAELEYLLEDSGARVLFTAAALAGAWQPLASDLTVVVCEGEVPGYPTLQGLTATPAAPFRAREMERDDPAAILYTSGTTGKQKGATLSHGNLVSNAFAGAHVQGIMPDDRLLLFLPLFHVFGQNAILNTSLAAAATVVLQRRFDPEETLSAIERDRVTMFFAVPTIYIALLNLGVHPTRLAKVRYYFSAAATMPVEIANRWRETHGQPIVEGYGLTETAPFASYNHIWQHKPGSVGTPIENVEVAVLDPDDNDVAPGTWGEICIKGPNVMLGYWNRPEESALALRHGWFHSGDIGYIDADGYIFLVDRVKDMINSAGFKIWPREVEEVLFTHSAIKECAVVGLPDDLKGEIPAVFVVLRDGASLTADELEGFCRQKLAAYKVPRRIEFVASLPKNATGKILKRALRDDVRTALTSVPVAARPAGAS
jgi:long-chain acyl-CoA synthetase